MGLFNIMGKSVAVPVCHLTSDRSPDAPKKRAEQIHRIFGETKSFFDGILLGDFNFGDGPENAAISWGSWKDVWPQLNASNPGLTFDPSTNTVAKITTSTGNSRRLDRIIVKGDSLKPVKIEMLGTASFGIDIDGSSEQMLFHPSDHYGLLCEFNL